jgi:hypothetical protein
MCICELWAQEIQRQEGIAIIFQRVLHSWTPASSKARCCLCEYVFRVYRREVCGRSRRDECAGAEEVAALDDSA